MEKFYKTIFQNSMIGLIIFDCKGRITDINPALVNILGSPSAEATKQINMLTFPLLVNTGISEKVKLALDEGKSSVFETKYFSKWGKSVYFKVHVSPLFDEKTKLQGGFGFVEDITINKLIEEILKQSEEKYKNIVNTAREGICIFNKNKDITFINQRMAEMLGYTVNEMLGKSILDFFFDKNGYISKEIMKINKKTEDLKIIRKDGSILWVILSSNPLLNEKGEYIGSLAMITDITRRKKMEEFLRLIEERYRIITENIKDTVWIMDMNFNTTWISPSVTRLRDFTLEEISRIPIDDQMPPESFQFFQSMAIPKLTTSNLKNPDCLIVIEGEFEFYKKDGSTFWTYTIFSLIRDEKGKPIGFLGVGHDIDKQKKTEAELIKSKEEAEKANKAKSEFLANMSHEIRTPLNAIIGFTDILTEEEKSPEKLEMMNLIKQSGDSLLEVINAVLDLSKIEAGKVRVLNEVFNLPESIKLIVNTLNNMAKSKGLEIVYSIDKEIINYKNFIGDEYKLKQILLNLINNAIKFTENGLININAKIKEKAENIFIIEFIVKDSGIGIPENMTDKIFDQFVQVEHYLTKKYKGAGLGLSIVNSLVKILNGDIEVKSEAGKGTEFMFTLPFGFATKDEALINDYIYIDNSSLVNLNILVAEDDEINQKLISKIAKRNNLNIEIVENGKEVLQKLQNKKFDIILMDVMMPDMDGIEATKCIRSGQAGEQVANIPIIALTAHALKEQHVDFLSAGMDYVIVKPINSTELIVLIKKFCDISDTGIIVNNKELEEENLI